MVHIRGRGSTVTAQWFFPQNHHPESAPGGTVSALVCRWPEVRHAVPRNRFRGPVNGDSFSHVLMLTRWRAIVNRCFTRGAPRRRLAGGAPGVKYFPESSSDQ